MEAVNTVSVKEIGSNKTFPIFQVFINFARQQNQLSSNATQHQDPEHDDCTTVNLSLDYDEPLIELSPRSVRTHDPSDDELLPL